MPGNFHTLYGHCDTFSEKAGRAGGHGRGDRHGRQFGLAYGKALYFEIRQSLKPLDPLLWLAKR